MRDLACGVACGKADGHLILDLDKYEDNLGKSDIPTILSPRTNEILLYQMDGYLSKEQLLEGLEKVQTEAVPKLREEMARALKEKYGGMAENGGVDQ